MVIEEIGYEERESLLYNFYSNFPSYIFSTYISVLYMYEIPVYVIVWKKNFVNRVGVRQNETVYESYIELLVYSNNYLIYSLFYPKHHLDLIVSRVSHRDTL